MISHINNKNSRILDVDLLESMAQNDLIDLLANYHRNNYDSQQALEKSLKLIELSKVNYQELLDEAPISYVIYDQTLEIKWFNNNFKELLNLESEVDYSFQDFLALENRDDFKKYVGELVENKGITSITLSLIKDDVEVLVRIKSNRHEDKFIRSEIIDISTKDSFENKLENQKRYFKSCIDALNYPFYIIDPKTNKIIDYNKTMSDYLENNPEGLSCYRVAHGNDKTCHSDRHKCPLSIVKDTLKPAVVEHYITDKTSTERIVELHAYPIFGKNGDLESVMQYSLDITDRKHIEEKLQNSESSSQSLMKAIEQSASTIVMTDLSGTIYYVNPKFEKTTGYTVEEAIGNSPRILSSGYTSKEEYKLLWLKISSGESWRGEFYNKKKDNTFYWESATISPIKNDSGIITGYLAVKEDITERKLSEASLKYQKQSQELISNISSMMIETNLSSFEEHFNTAIEMIYKFVNASSGLGLIFNDNTNEMPSVFTTQDMGGMLSNETAYYSVDSFDWCIDLKLHVKQIESSNIPDKHNFKRVIEATKSKNIVALTLVHEQKISGLILFGFENPSRELNDELMMLFKTLSDILSGVIIRRKTTYELSNNEAKLRRYLDFAPDGVMVNNKDGDIIEVNPSILSMTGYSENELLEMNLSDLFDEGFDWSGFFSGNKDKTLEGEWLIKTNKNSFKWLSVAIVQIYNDQFLGFYKDVSDRKSTYEKLQRREALLNVSQELTHVGAWRWDVIQEKLFWTDEVYRIYGLNTDSNLLKQDNFLDKVTSCYCKNDRKIHNDAFKRVIACGEAYDLEVKLISFDNVNKWVRVTGKPIFKNDQVISVIGNTMDITNKKNFEEALKASRRSADKANAVKSDFLANMSHEIRTPMNAILGMVNMISNTTLSYEQKNYLDMVSRSSHNLLDIINDILDFSKIEAGKLELENIPFDLDEVIKDVSSVISATAHDRGIKFYIDTPPGITKKFIGDPLRIRQVLINILGNGVKFTNDGFISLTVLLNESSHINEVEFQIKDTGIGMSEGQVNNLFEPFTQANDSITRKYGGTGLGLSISKNLVEQMGGKIVIKSSLGSGSIFSFKLKFNEDVTTKNKLVIKEFIKSALVIHDDTRSFNILKIYLEYLGMSVKEEHINQLENKQVMSHIKKFDLVILDCLKSKDLVNIQRMMNFSTQKLLVLKDYGDDVSRVKYEFLMKPFTFKEIYTEVENLYETRVKVKKDKKVEKSLIGSRILLVDDYLINQKIGKLMIEKWGGEVTLADSGFMALELVGKNDYDVILLDIQMPDLDGLTVARRMRKMPKLIETPIIAMTAHGMKEDIEKSFAAGMNDHIIKPIMPDRLLSVLKNYIEPVFEEDEHDIKIFLQYLDIEAGLKQCLNDKSTYKEILEYVLDHHKNDGVTFQYLYSSGQIEEIFKLLHQFRNLSANIGAVDLREKIATFEDILGKTSNKDLELKAVEELVLAFEGMMGDVKIYLEQCN